MALPKAEVEVRMKRFAETCRRSGLKITHQRTEVFRELAAREDHPGAESVFQQVRRRVPAISRDTVYRALALLEAQGLIRKAEILFNQGRYDANTERHHHFVCTMCGRVQDFYSEALDDLPLPRSVKALGRVQSAQVQVRGVCSACAAGGSRRRRTK
jgi:Fur family peroxide stress response transcriptional regulator